jgi:hypothetical protein
MMKTFDFETQKTWSVTAAPMKVARNYLLSMGGTSSSLLMAVDLVVVMQQKQNFPRFQQEKLPVRISNLGSSSQPHILKNNKLFISVETTKECFLCT